MHRIALLFGLICFILAAAGSYFGAIYAVDRFERSTEAKLEQAIFLTGDDWSNIRANGLRIHLTGLAPNETCLLYTSPSPRDVEESRMPSSA